MTGPNGVDSRLQEELRNAVADVWADQVTVTRLIDNAKTDELTRRRNRVWIAPLLAAAAVVAIVVTTSAVISSSHKAHQTPPGHSSSVPVPAPSSSPPSNPTVSANDHVLGPNGLGKLKLGMTHDEAAASGALTQFAPDPGSGCVLLHLAGRPVDPSRGDGYFSHALGIAAIFAPPGVKTPEGIGVGSTIAQVEHAYPTIRYDVGSRQDGGPRVQVPGNPAAFYEFPVGTDDRVDQISIALYQQDCFS